MVSKINQLVSKLALLKLLIVDTGCSISVDEMSGVRTACGRHFFIELPVYECERRLCAKSLRYARYLRLDQG